MWVVPRSIFVPQRLLGDLFIFRLFLFALSSNETFSVPQLDEYLNVKRLKYFLEVILWICFKI